ncbi:MAG: hypothetical protein GYB68_05710, partial [Chloroflexi bacterium]|nr:hypothetical protein [Chloroflexota bacterium]
ETIIDSEAVTLYYHHDKGIVHHVYHPTIGGEALMNALNTGVALLETHGANKWLSDNRAIDAHTEEETEWANTVWLPNAIAAGWKYWALVVPSSVKGRLNMNEFVRSFDEQGVRVMVFVDPEEAMDWLERVDA